MTPLFFHFTNAYDTSFQSPSLVSWHPKYSVNGNPCFNVNTLKYVHKPQVFCFLCKDAWPLCSNSKSGSNRNSFREGFPQTNADIIHSLAQGGVTKPAASTVLLRRRGERKGKEGDEHVMVLLRVVPCGPCYTRPRYVHLGHNPYMNQDATQLLLQYIRS